MKTSVEIKTRRSLLVENQGLRATRGREIDAPIAPEVKSPVLTRAASETACRLLIEAVNEGAAILGEDGTVLYCNGRLAAMLKAPIERVMGASLMRFVRAEEAETLSRLLARGHSESCSVETRFRCERGEGGPVKLALSPMHIPSLRGACVVVTDLAERNRTEELRHLSLVDELTGLSNRRGFFTLAQQQRTLARRLRTPTALVFIDLDGFKIINDTFGHGNGDCALTDVARLLKNTYRESDIIARIGGDEFAVLASGTPEMRMETLRTRLRTNLDAFNQSAHRPYQLAMSVGMVRCDPENSLPMGELLALADAAMYRQKRRKQRPAPPIAGRLRIHPGCQPLSPLTGRLPRMIS